MNVTGRVEFPNNTTCEPAFSYGNFLFAVVPCFQIITNVIVIVAVARNRNRLRHNFVYVYVINTLLANTLFGVFSLYSNASDVFALERKWHSESPFSWNSTEDRPRMNWWAFRSAHVVTLFTAMSGSICALCYGIRESSYFVGRVARQSLNIRNSRQSRLQMGVILFLVWIFPITLDFAAALGWNCSQNCKCIPAQYRPEAHPCSPGSHSDCSKILLAQKKSFGLIILAMWFVESMVIIYLNITAIKKYNKVINSKNFQSRLKTSSNLENSDYCGTNNQPKDGDVTVACQNDFIVTMNNVVRVTSPDSDARTSHTYDISKDGKKVWNCPSPSCLKLSFYNHNIKLLLTLSTLFVICTLPSMIILIVDAASEELSLTYATARSVILFAFVYCLISPLVLIYYMTGVRVAVNRMLFNCTVCTKTVAVSNSTASVTSVH